MLALLALVGGRELAGRSVGGDARREPSGYRVKHLVSAARFCGGKAADLLALPAFSKLFIDYSGFPGPAAAGDQSPACSPCAVAGRGGGLQSRCPQPLGLLRWDAVGERWVGSRQRRRLAAAPYSKIKWFGFFKDYYET